MSKPDETYRQWATPTQWRTYAAVCEHGSTRKAAKALGMARSGLQEGLATLKRKAVQQGYDPPDWLHPIPDGQVLKGMSTNYESPAEGIKEQWVKTKEGPMQTAQVVQLPGPHRIERVSTNYTQGGVQQQWVREVANAAQREEAWKTIVDELRATIEPLPLLKAPASTLDDYMAVLPIGDHHLGMLAWAEETGSDNYDSKISEQLLNGAIDYLVTTGPACGTGLLIFLGDFFHYDGLVAETPTSRNHLDSEGRYAKMQRFGVRMIRHAIDAAAKKYGELFVIFEPGNHDPSTMQAAAIWCAALYEANPRVHIDLSPRLHHYHRFGKNLIGTHHGDKTKMDLLPMVMAADVPLWWGETSFRYWFTGHIHTQVVKEFPGASVESMNILAPPDAWAAGQGYRSRRNMKQIILHRETGEYERRIVNPTQLEIKQ